MKIEILGIGCPKCKELALNAEAAARELGINPEIVKVTDLDRIIARGVMMTPAIAVDGVILSSGKLLDKEEIKKLISK